MAARILNSASFPPTAAAVGLADGGEKRERLKTTPRGDATSPTNTTTNTNNDSNANGGGNDSGDDVSSEVSGMLLHPLTTQEKRAVRQLVNAYAHFWSNTRFGEDFIAPPFSRAEVCACVCLCRRPEYLKGAAQATSKQACRQGAKYAMCALLSLCVISIQFH